MRNKIKKIVIVGGGNGSAISINAVKNFGDKVKISAIVSTSDSNGSSGQLRKEFKTLPPGDVMRAVLAMSPYDYDVLKKIFYRNRFENCGKLDKHDLGNLFLVWAEKYAKDYMSAVRALEQAVGAIGHVYPNSLQQSDLVAELVNGKTIKTEGKIDRPDESNFSRIKKLWLEPKVKASDGAIKEIKEADYIIMGPGSLYTSIVAAILPTGIKEAIKKSKAKLIYVCGNAYEKIGEKGPGKLSEFVKELQTYLPRKIDLIIFDNAKLDKKQSQYYKEKKWNLIVNDRHNIPEYNVIAGNFERTSGGLCPAKLGKILNKIIWK
ncbi:MAG TPA: hypothetical protein DEB09_01350 [Candidatus Magasanikbacteria bacterium]|nr:hypothetical protein [Candidatus Magasanikbacteria bacterium]